MKSNKIRLGEQCVVTSSKRFHLSERITQGVPFYCSKEIIKKFNGEDVTECDYISEDLYKKVSNEFGVPKENDLLITTRGTIGIPYLYKRTDRFYFADGNLTWIKDFDSNLYSKFLYYWFQSYEGRKKFEALAKGTAQKAVPISGIKTLEIELPSLKDQKRIADILSAYDDLIENNQKQIKLLEEAAQRIYKEWFVDLRFPGHENTKIVDGVPEEWRKFPLEEIAPVVTGKKDANYGDKGGNYPFFTCSQETITAPGYSFDTSAVILAGNGDFNVKLYRGKFEAYQRTYVLAPFDHSNLFNLYFTVQDNMEALAKGASGSTIKFLTKGMLQKILVLIADKKILDKFNDYEENIQQKVEALKKQVEDLTEIRNRLLPKLMSGEVEV